MSGPPDREHGPCPTSSDGRANAFVHRVAHRTWHKWNNGSRYKWLGWMVSGAAIGVLISIGLFWAQPSPFDPLAPAATQIVTSRVPAVDGPAVRLGDDVKVTATICNESDESIKVGGFIQWETVQPRGTAIARTDFGGRPVLPGCTEFQFANVMPDEVVERTEQLFEQGVVEVVWRVVGESIPVSSSGEEGVPSPFTTQNFRVVP